MTALTVPEVPNMTMTSREIAELTGKEHKHVLRDVEVMLQELALPSDRYAQNWTHPQNGQTYREFSLTKDLTITLVSGYSVTMRHRIVTRWQELEEQEIAPSQSFAIPQTFTEALRLAADLAEGKAKAELEVEQKQKLLAVATPKADAFDAIAASTETMTFTQAAKILSKKRKDLTQRLHAERWIYPQNGSWLAYDSHIRSGYLVYKEAKYTDEQTGMERHKPYCHVTPKGLTKMALLFGDSSLRQ